MITFYLFRIISKPPITHPLFDRLINQSNRVLPWYAWLIGVIILPYIIMMIVIFSATTFGIRWLIDSHNTLSRQIKQGTHTLIATSPVGEIGARWLIIMGTFYRGESFQRLNSLGFWGGRLFVVLTALYIVINPAPSARQFPPPETTPLEVNITLVTVILLGFAIHHYQSIALCATIALLIPTFTHEARTAPLIAVGTFIITQLLSYLLSFILGFLLLPTFIDGLKLSTNAHDIAQMIVQLLIFVIIREAIVTLFWLITHKRYHLQDTKNALMFTVAPNIIDESIT